MHDPDTLTPIESDHSRYGDGVTTRIGAQVSFLPHGASPDRSRQQPTSLTDADVDALFEGYRSRFTARQTARYFLIGAAVVLIIGAFTAPYPPCTQAAPCVPDRASWALMGLVVVVPFLRWWFELWFTAAMAGVMAIGLAWWDYAHPLHANPVWVHVLTGCYALGGGLLAWEAARHRTSTWRRWRARWPDHQRPPRPERQARPPLALALWAGAWIAAAVGCAAVVEVRQSQVEAQQAAAVKVTATVQRQFDEALYVALSDGSMNVTVPVAIPNEYPIGSTIGLAMDADGLLQPLSEPYDATVVYALVCALAVVGLGLLLRFAGRVFSRRRLFRRPQPVSRVWVRRGEDRLFLYTGDAEPAFAELPIDYENVLGGRSAHAVLYGTPAVENWCTVTVGAVTLSPTGPLQPTMDFAPTRSSSNWSA